MAFLDLLQNCLIPKLFFPLHRLFFCSPPFTQTSQVDLIWLCLLRLDVWCRPHNNSYLAILFSPTKAVVVLKPPETFQRWWRCLGPLTKLERRQGSQQQPMKSHSVPREGPKQSDLFKDSEVYPVLRDTPAENCSSIPTESILGGFLSQAHRGEGPGTPPVVVRRDALC